MKVDKVHCLFEQSGTFKNEFKRLGIDAVDYDILDEFGETDYIVDLFEQIRNAYEGNPSLFDSFGQNDLIMAFFPCIRFENQVMLMFRGQQAQMKSWSLERKMQNCMKIQEELTELYELVNKMFIVCIRKGLRLIVENPYSEEHYLRRYWCLPATLIDRDRRQRGDYFCKPTQYWFVNCDPSHNFIFEAQKFNAIQVKDAIESMNQTHIKECGISASTKAARSIIHSDYANRFIREFILDEDEGNELSAN